MTFLLAKNPPLSEEILLARCQRLAGLTFAQLAAGLGLEIPEHSLQRKGWLGCALEQALGATAGSKAHPDFCDLQIELKTLPIGYSGKPKESTFVTSIPLLTLHQQTFESSSCFAKLRRVLWVPVEGERALPYAKRRLGMGFLWSPNEQQEAILKADWLHLTSLLTTGQRETLDARQGEYLQVRPKGLNAKSLCFGFDEEGNKVRTLPLGFYLRSLFTAQILQEASSA
jgi:DNA mismatch repair protein MutH